jgi:metal-responsive CopG/Arc/MetJ family transcriptional regulator
LYIILKQGVKTMEKQSVMLRIPRVLLERIDKFKEDKGFGTRTQAIFYLVNYALEQIVKSENTSTI